MQTGTDIRTDDRLVGILEGGKHFLSTIDPEAILSGASPSKLIIDYGTKYWKLFIVFQNGAICALSGTIDDGIFIVSKAHFPANGGKWEDAQLANPSKTVLKALGDLSRIPYRLKPYLSRETKRDGNTGVLASDATPFIQDAWNATFFRVEGASNEKVRKRFNKIRFDYTMSERGETIKTEITATCRTQTGLVNVTCETDIYGVGGKKVMLVKDLGMNRSAVINCLGMNKDKPVPSIRVAFDLDEIIHKIYNDERTKDKNIGKPVATGKNNK